MVGERQDTNMFPLISKKLVETILHHLLSAPLQMEIVCLSKGLITSLNAQWNVQVMLPTSQFSGKQKAKIFLLLLDLMLSNCLQNRARVFQTFHSHASVQKQEQM